MSQSKAGHWPEGLDLPRILGGHGSPRKSKNTQGILSGEPDPIHQTKRLELKRDLLMAGQRKRIANLVKARRIKKQITSQPDLFKRPCYRRVLELSFFLKTPRAKNFAYIAPPKLIQSRPKKLVYELILAGSAYCSFTDAAEALCSVMSLRAHGFPSAVMRQIDLSQP